ncbi:cupin domain-containing protein [Roseomonas sp. SSH11]|uniref:Cupin domain-containing protein n=1 Tax=Pararoseomonas baculiformis TaxID=2820812 RepID=A0ABS4ABJ5_9PROT|nr:cupin domain-containing protein [Pararoseomonas baculiformis]MBP0444380.1 cupin domain-containing protein [Pararoseomonas baculiformis]
MAGSGLRMAQAGEAVPFEIPGATGEFRIQILNEDKAKGVVTSIVHLPAGGKIPAHHHDAGEEMHYVLEGDLIEAGETLGAGAFLTHAKGVVHGPHESRGGAKVLTVQTWQSQGGEFDFIPEGDAAAGGSGGQGSSSGQGSGGQGSGGQASGGQASGGQASGGQASGGQASGGQASGGQASGGQASGGSSSGSSTSQVGAESQEEAAKDHRNKGYS